ncbi:hypothetical protein ACFL0Z_02125 [Patescibacteria group bacterium]
MKGLLTSPQGKLVTGIIVLALVVIFVDINPVFREWVGSGISTLLEAEVTEEQVLEKTQDHYGESAEYGTSAYANMALEQQNENALVAFLLMISALLLLLALNVAPIILIGFGVYDLIKS